MIAPLPDDPRDTPDPPAAPHAELTARLLCLRCRELAHDLDPAEGRTWWRCRKCDAHWLAFVLPAGATGRDLAMVMGVRPASLLIRRLVPAASELPDAILWEWTLAAQDHAAYLQVAVTGRQRHLHRFAEVPALLRALSLVA